MKVVFRASGSHRLDECAKGVCGRPGFPDVSDLSECAVRNGVGFFEDGVVQR